MNKIINLTSEDIHILDGENKVVATHKPSGRVACVESSSVQDGKLDGESPAYQVEYGDVSVFDTTTSTAEAMPDPCTGVVYAVSPKVFSAPEMKNRSDLATPFMPVVNQKGKMLGYRGFEVSSEPDRTVSI